MIKYLGSKRLLVPFLTQILSRLIQKGTVIDLFSGTARVGHAFKNAGYRVLSVDHNEYAATLARCYVEADADEGNLLADAARIIDELNRLPGQPGYFTTTFCEQSQFFQPKNGERIDAIREAIERGGHSPALRAVLLTSLMEAADRVDSTVGVQMAYLKSWAARSHNDLQLRLPQLLPVATAGKGQAFCLSAEEASASLVGDAAYLDPPYNQHKYLGNYHVWESLVRWDKPAVYGVACKRVDCRERGSAFNSKRTAHQALDTVISRLTERVDHIMVSFNNEGYIQRGEIIEMLGRMGDVVVFDHEYKRHVGAKIGVHNQKGDKVGTVGKLRNIESIFVASRSPEAVDRLRALHRDLVA